MAELTLAPPADEDRTYDDNDFLVLSEEVDRIAGVVAELIKAAQCQSKLIGILLDATGLEPVVREAACLGKLIPIISHMADRIAELEIQVDDPDNTDDYKTEPGTALRTYFDGWSDAERDAYAEEL